MADLTLPSVAILMATYNGGLFVADQVYSILSQLAVQPHIFIRDDGSSDDTISVIKRLQRAHPLQITIINDDSGPTGSAAANFFALLKRADFASFDYVALADQDDIWLPEKLQRAVICLSKHGSGGYSSNLIAWQCGNNRYWGIEKGGEPKRMDYLFQGASAGCTYVLNVSTALMVRQRVDLLGGQYCNDFSHDWAIYAICRSANVGWHYDNKSFIHYRQHGGNVYGARPGLGGVVARLKMMNNGWYRSHILWLENIIENHPRERIILAKMKRNSLADRLYLAAKAGHFRRQRSDVWKLRLAFLLGLLNK